MAARSFHAGAAPRWLLCGAAGSPSVFALPWGRAGHAAHAEAVFPTAIELLNTPSLALEPTPVSGTRGIHRIAGVACRMHLAEAFGLARERDFFSGATAMAGCELCIVLSDQAVHVVLLATAQAIPGQIESPATAMASPQKTAPDSEEAVPLPEDSSPSRLPQPLVAHLLSGPAKAAKPSMLPPPPTATRMRRRAKPGRVVGSEAAPAPSASPSAEAALLHARAEELEQRAIKAEQQLAELQTSFKLFANQSREQTNMLLAALERLMMERAQPSQASVPKA